MTERRLSGPGAHVAGGRIQEQDLRGRDLTGISIQACVLHQVGLAGARLSEARIEGGATFERCDLGRAELQRCLIRGSTFRHSALFRADASGAHLRQSVFEDCNLAGAQLRGSRWAHVSVDRGHTDGLDLTEATLVGVRFSNSVLGGSSLTRASLRGALLVGCDLRSANLYGADLTGALLVGCDLSGAHFDDVTLDGAALIQCRIARADWGGEIPAEIYPQRSAGSQGMSEQDWSRIYDDLSADQGWTPDRLRRVLRTLIEEYVLGQGLPTGTADQAMGDDLAGLDFPSLMAHLKRTLTLPELDLFQVDGQKVYVDADGPREISMGRASEPPRPSAPRPAAPRPAAPQAAPAARPSAQPGNQAAPQTTPAPDTSKDDKKADRPLSRRFHNLEFD